MFVSFHVGSPSLSLSFLPSFLSLDLPHTSTCTFLIIIIIYQLYYDDKSDSVFRDQLNKLPSQTFLITLQNDGVGLGEGQDPRAHAPPDRIRETWVHRGS